MANTPYEPVNSSLPAGTPETRTWRPWSLRPSFLIGFIVLCIILSMGIELVIRGCTPAGCHVFGRVTTELSNADYFTYNQLPTVLSLFLGLVWAVPHHDIMRLEPYFRMSVPGGTSAAESLLLDYPYTFAPLVPYLAAKRRHHEVLLSSCITLTMGFLVTPLISAIFDDALLSYDIPATALRGVLRPVTANSTLSSQFTYEAYNNFWRNRTLPPFTEPEYAMLPLIPNNTTKALLNEEDWVTNTEEVGDDWKTNIEVWTANTTLFEAEIQCKPTDRIVFKPRNDSRISVSITSTGGEYIVNLCDQQGMNPTPPEISKTLLASNITRSPISHDKLQCDGYTRFIAPWTAIAQRVNSSSRAVNGSEVYLFGWASGPSTYWGSEDPAPPPTNITAIFCTTRYYSQTVTATFEMPNGKLVKVHDTGVREPFLDLLNFDAIINGDTGALAAAPIDPNNVDDSIFGYRPAHAPNDDSQLQQRFELRPWYANQLFWTDTDKSSHSLVYMDNINGLAGLALSNVSNDALSTLFDPKELESTYRKTLRKIFAIAVTVEMVSDDQNAIDTISVMRTIFRKGFKVNTPWARGAQGGLVVVALMAALLIVLMRRRPCNLDGEPNSLAEALRLLAASPELCTEMENAEFHRPEVLADVFNDGQGLYTLDLVPGYGPRILRTSAAFGKYSEPLTPGKPNQVPWTGQLWQLRFMTGLIFLTFFWVVGLLLSVAFGFSRAARGIPLSATLSSFPRKVAFSYIPTAIGMAAEPIVIAIAICHCMIAPYAMLTRGAPTSSKALAVDFDKSPPHFQIVRSLRTRNIPLAALTVSILLCNLLAVALAGLFSITNRPFDSTEVTYPSIVFLRRHALPQQEMYHVLAEQLSGRDDTLPLTTPEYYILPVHADPRVTVERFEAPAIGIRLDVNCSLIPEKDVFLDCIDPSCERQTSPLKESLYDYSASVDHPCWNPLGGIAGTHSKLPTFPDYHWKGLSYDNMVRSSRCSNAFFPLWVERSSIPRLAGSANLTNGNRYLDSLVMSCDIHQKNVQLNIVVSKNSKLQSVSAVRTLNLEEMSWRSRTFDDEIAKIFFSSIEEGLQTRNTLDYHQMRWINYLMKLIEPKIVRNTTYRSQIPDRDHVVSAFEDVYRRLFVIFLKLSEDAMFDLGEPETMIVKATVKAWRVDVSPLMYCLAGSIILVIVVVLILLYWRRQQTVGYLPTTLAGLYALLYASNAKEECGELYGSGPAERAKNLEDVGGLYACGPFADGKHYGVHRTGKLAETETEAERPLLQEY